MTSKGHIYKIICKVDEKFCYIGSTFNRLSKRFEEHRNYYNSWKNGKSKKSCSCFPYFDKYGIENFKIVLIKSYDVVRTHIKDRRHLEAYETLWICKTKCVNKNLPIRYLNKLMLKEYRENNKESISQKDKKYYEKNKNTINQKKKEYYETNRDEISKKVAEKVQCECGATVSRSGLSRHKKTDKHKKLLLLNK
jgi:hypothetical protein